MRPEHWQKLTENGIALLRQSQPVQALKQLKLAQQQAPKEREPRYWLANAYRMTGDTHRARTLFRKLLTENPGDFDTSFALAFLMRDSGAPADAAKVLLKAAKQPGVPEYQLLQIVGFLRDSNQYTAAIQVCEKTARLNPGSAELHFKLARLYQATGTFDAALMQLRKTLDLNPSLGPAWTILAQQKQFRADDDPEFMRIQAAAGQAYGLEADMCIAFAYGKALDDMERWPQAWAQYQRGNSMMSGAAPWKMNARKKFLEQTTASKPRNHQAVPGSGRSAVFIVGMLRSGTTLLEQMLDRHPNISGRGELNFLAHFAEQDRASGSIPESRRKEAEDLLWNQLRLSGPEDGIYLDKNPLNFRYFDILFEIMPTARVLHVTRDGRDSCLSCYFQLFEHADTAFSNKLEDLIEFYSGYRRMMARWEKLYSDRIYRVNYDDLVHSGADVLAKVLQFLGARWDESVTQTAGQERVIRTASVWQARQAIHTRSVARWRHYYDQAPQFFNRLAAIDSEYDDSV